MKRPTCTLLAGAFVVSIAALYAQQNPEQPPRLRSGVDVVRVEASVLDKTRRPVRGLTAADFVVLENGQERPVAAFAAVDLPASPPRDEKATGWVANAPRAAVRNQTGSLTPAEFAKSRTANVRLPLPLDALPAGQYLLTFDASLGDLRAERLLRVEIR